MRLKAAAVEDEILLQVGRVRGVVEVPRSGELWLRQRPVFWRTTTTTRARVLANYGYDKGPRSGELRLRQRPAFWRTTAMTKARVLANYGYDKGPRSGELRLRQGPAFWRTAATGRYCGTGIRRESAVASTSIILAVGFDKSISSGSTVSRRCIFPAVSRASMRKYTRDPTPCGIGQT
jgi:hypothetical protein